MHKCGISQSNLNIANENMKFIRSCFVLFSLNLLEVSSVITGKNGEDECIFRIQEDLSGICINIGPDPAPEPDEAAKLLIDFSDYRLIAKDTLSNLTRLEEIVVESGDLMNLERGALCFPPRLSSIQLNLHLNINPVSRGLLEGCRNLRRLKITSSRIIDKDAFADFSDRLKIVRFDKITDRFFENLTSATLPNVFTSSLEKLRVSHCDVENLDRDFFAGSANLKEINLSSNKLRTIENGTFVGLKLQRLDLSQNDLGEFPIELIAGSLDSLEILDLGLNRRIRGWNSTEILADLRAKNSKLKKLTINSLAFGDEADFGSIQAEFMENGINLIETGIN